MPTRSSPVRHVRRPKATPFDLHALGTPPALILSQDQTLHHYVASRVSSAPTTRDPPATRRPGSTAVLTTTALLRLPHPARQPPPQPAQPHHSRLPCPQPRRSGPRAAMPTCQGAPRRSGLLPKTQPHVTVGRWSVTLSRTRVFSEGASRTTALSYQRLSSVLHSRSDVKDNP